MPIMTKEELQALEDKYNNPVIKNEAPEEKETPNQCEGCKYLGSKKSCYSCVVNPNKEV
jgi:hypothetical protein